jgi:nicotinate-nucleotide adenylyltransferase
MDRHNKLKKQKKIAILGGTFDPIHYGHLLLAQSVINQFDVEKVIFIPTGNPYNKEYYKVLDANQRQHMTSLAISDNEMFEVSNIDILRSGNTYSVDTITKIKSMYNEDTKIFFIVGSDYIKSLQNWKDIDKIFSLCEIIVAKRPNTQISNINQYILSSSYANKINVLEAPMLNISSTRIRNNVKNNESIKYLVPKEVESYIKLKNIYENYTKYDICKLKQKLSTVLSKKRYEHSISVAQTSSKIARHYKQDEEKAYVAGLLHDYAKELNEEQMLEACKKININIEEYKTNHISLAHGAVGAKMVKHELNINDTEILDAITTHTLGCKDMSILQKIIYIADTIEPNRQVNDKIVQITKLVYENIDKSLYLTIKLKIDYTIKKGKVPSPLALEILEYYST